jgi:ribonuclease BN (tRNA processing enzyme)
MELDAPEGHGMSEAVTVTFVGSGDAFGSGGRFQACFHLRIPGLSDVLVDCGATSLTALKSLGLDPGEIAAVFVSHLHGDHFGGLPFLILDGQFSHRTDPLTVIGPPGISQRLPAAMEVMYPGSSTVRRRFEVNIVELEPGVTTRVAGLEVSGWEVDHPCGAPPLALRLRIGDRVIAYTGDTAWTDVLVEVARDADLLIAEAYYQDKRIPYHLRLADLLTHQHRLNARRIVLTHMSTEMLDRDLVFETAHDGHVIHV